MASMRSDFSKGFEERAVGEGRVLGFDIREIAGNKQDWDAGMFRKDLACEADTVTGVLEENIRDQKVDLVSLGQGQGFLGVDCVDDFVTARAELSFH